MFIGLLVPSLKNSKPIVLVVLISMSISLALSWLPLTQSMSAGWKIIISTMIAALAAAIIYPKGLEV
jgi:predicted branched-subunit amino acid permease